MLDPKLATTRNTLKVVYGLVPFLAGLDKFFDLLADWPSYLSPAAQRVLPFSAGTFMHIVGIIEMLVGLAILTRWTRLGAYVASAWLVLIALNLVSSGHYLDVAVRDVTMAFGAFTLARLEEVRLGIEARRPARGLEPADAHT